MTKYSSIKNPAIKFAMLDFDWHFEEDTENGQPVLKASCLTPEDYVIKVKFVSAEQRYIIFMYIYHKNNLDKKLYSYALGEKKDIITIPSFLYYLVCYYYVGKFLEKDET